MTDRTCILSGQNLPREQLIRFVAGPDGHAVADLACKLPGRGVWIENNAESLRRVAARNLLTRRIGAGFREVEEDILQIAQMLRQRAFVVCRAGPACGRSCRWFRQAGCGRRELRRAAGGARRLGS